jgi:hypothetical protein
MTTGVVVVVVVVVVVGCSDRVVAYIGRQRDFCWCIRWPIASCKNEHIQINLISKLLRKFRLHAIRVRVARVTLYALLRMTHTVLNDTIMSLARSMSLNIPSSFPVNAAPHSIQKMPPMSVACMHACVNSTDDEPSLIFWIMSFSVSTLALLFNSKRLARSFL